MNINDIITEAYEWLQAPWMIVRYDDNQHTGVLTLQDNLGKLHTVKAIHKVGKGTLASSIRTNTRAYLKKLGAIRIINETDKVKHNRALTPYILSEAKTLLQAYSIPYKQSKTGSLYFTLPKHGTACIRDHKCHNQGTLQRPCNIELYIQRNGLDVLETLKQLLKPLG